MREVIEIKEIQNMLLPILKYIDKICRENGFRYSLSDGTLIGAVRHEGFIPWDDDIDIVMPRTDFNKLIEIFEKSDASRYKILSPYDPKSFYAGRMLKVYDSKTILYEYPEKYHIKYGAYVDIFPIDGLPSDEEKARKYHKEYKKYHKLLHYLGAYRFRKKNDIKRKISKILTNLYVKYVKKCKNYHNRYNYDKSSNIARLVHTSTLEKDLFKKEWFENLIDVKFEGEYFKIFADYDIWLTNYYGDYMKLPPKEEQVPHHIFKLYAEE